MRWLSVIVCLGACGRVGFDGRALPDDGALPDTSTPDGGCETFGAWSPPVRVAEISSIDDDLDATFSDDGLELVFSSMRAGGARDLWRSTRATRNDAWTTPIQIPELATASEEEGNPALSRDGLEMFYGLSTVFRTTRPTLQDPFFDREDVTPTNPDFFGAIGSDISRDGLELYFGAQPTDGTAAKQMYRARRATLAAPFSGYARLPSTNDSLENGFLTISGDGLELIYSRDDGDWEMRRMTRGSTAVEFDPATDELLEILETPENDADPDITSDGREIVFNSDRTGLGGYDLYISMRGCL